MIYTYQSRVRYSEVDENAVMTLFSLINNLQDCCTFHGEDSGVGLAWNTARGQAWIVADLQMQIARYPRFGERITVITWAESLRGLIARRNFRVESQKGAYLAEAATEWVLMDMIRQKPLRIPQEQIDGYGVHPDKKTEHDLGQRKILLPEEWKPEEPFSIQEYHLDTNRHVNNAQYVRLAVRYLPSDFTIHHLRVEFRKQAMLGDVIVPSLAFSEDGNSCVICLADTEGDVYFAAECRK